MEIIFIEGKHTGEVLLNMDTLRYLKDKKIKKLAFFTSVQFIASLDRIKLQLEKAGIRAITTKPKRTAKEGQLLGCDVYDSLNLKEDVDCFLYLGDGRFHPLALVYALLGENSTKEVICFNPIEKKMSVLGKSDISKIVKRRKGALVKFHSSKNIGVIVTIKPGQEQLKSALKLEEAYPDKKFYYFIDNNISFDQLENFPFVDLWVNTACPRIGLDDSHMFRKGVVNLMDVSTAVS